jgi:class 3 adenylate cyclase
VEIPDVHYARSGDVSIAYQVVGNGPRDLVLLPFLSNLYTFWKAPGFAPLGRRLAECRRLILVNLRGVGLSDRPRGFTIESRMDDLRAVLDAVASERATLLGLAEAGATCAVFAAANPERVERLILYDPWLRGVRDERERDQELAQIRQERERWGRRDVLEGMARGLNPQWAEDPEYLEWFVWHHRLTSSPATWAEFRRMQIDLDVSHVLPAIRVPTLVISKEHTRESAAEVAQGIPGAELVVVPGIGRAFFENEFAVEAIEAFLEGTPSRQVPDTVLATVLFTDLVGSTERAVELGDRAWRELLKRHNELIRLELARFRGVELDTAGDGFFARFDGPARAIRCSQAIVQGVRALGLDVRAGVHAGECEVHEEKVAGIAVSVCARVMAMAGPGQILVSSTVRDLVAGSGIDFEDGGTHELKGVPGEWRLYAVRDG